MGVFVDEWGGVMNLNPYFSSTCKILFGTEIGELRSYENYLNEMVEQPLRAKSSITGNDVVLSRRYHSKTARIISLDEIAKMPMPKLDINAIKDIDSLRNAVRDNLAYCGNSNVGVSTEIEASDACNDAAFTFASHQVIKSKNIAYSYGVRECENVFGCMLVGEVRYAIRTQITFKSVRCFESYLCLSSSDLYNSFNCRSCTDAIFSFNQTSKRNIIGNLELPKDKYAILKANLVGEMVDELVSKGNLPSLFELISTREGA